MGGVGPEGEPPRDAFPISQHKRPEQAEPQQGKPADASMVPDLQEQQGWIERSNAVLVAAFRQAIRLKRLEWRQQWHRFGCVQSVPSRLVKEAIVIHRIQHKTRKAEDPHPSHHTQLC
jgi:hypothetical protein